MSAQWEDEDHDIANTYWELSQHQRVEMSYPRHSVKDLVIWCDDVVYKRVPHKIHIECLQREDAMELLAPIWDQFVHKGVFELAAQPPPVVDGAASSSVTTGGAGDSAPRRIRKRVRRSAARPREEEVEVEEARDECPPPPPSVEQKRKRKRKKGPKKGAT